MGILVLLGLLIGISFWKSPSMVLFSQRKIKRRNHKRSAQLEGVVRASKMKQCQLFFNDVKK
jgi:hypothetical protein